MTTKKWVLKALPTVSLTAEGVTLSVFASVTQMKNNLPHVDIDMTRLCHLGLVPSKWSLIAPSCLLWRINLQLFKLEISFEFPAVGVFWVFLMSRKDHQNGQNLPYFSSFW